VVLAKKAMSKSSSRIGRWIAALIALALLVLVFVNVVQDNNPPGEARLIEGYTAWPKNTLEVAETIPVQNGGRVKPLSAYAGFTMLGLHGARSMEVTGADGKVLKIKPTAWLLDTLYRPQLAAKLPTFRIDNSAILEAIGLPSRGKRDRYSYADISPARTKLLDLAQSYELIKENRAKLGEPEGLDPIQSQTLILAYNLRKYECLLNYFNFARYGVTLLGSGENGGPDKHADTSAILMTAPQIRQQAEQSQAAGKPIEPHVKSILDQVLNSANDSKFELFMLPPPDAKELVWQSAGNAIMGAFTDPKKVATAAVQDIAALESTARAVAESSDIFHSSLVTLRDNFAKRAEARGEYRYVELEAKFYRQNAFLYGLVFFIMGTLTALAMWTVSKGIVRRILYWLTFAVTLTGLSFCVYAIVQRCIIMQRPPIVTLYDTITFIAVTVVLIALLIEWMTRRRFALGTAPILGTVLILLARRYELGDAKDNMDPLIAVLDSNYWLTTHVITITLGYAAGLLSAFLSVIYLLMRGLGLDNGDRDLRRSLTRAVYGMICFTLFLSLVGTVLGGIWANDSWGRFWGWDPKENGALLIVLWTLAILHGRLGGYIREWGLHFSAVFTAAVVAFSWWHVNFLNTGLHNYGFTADKKYMLFVFYGIIAAIIIFGIIAKVIEKSQKEARLPKDALPVG
jgi:ABC-type transport system involved in cytochrome c biogenesis permease subunit